MPTKTKNENKKKANEITDEVFFQDSHEIFQSLIIEDVKYKTRLTKKFVARKNYEPKDPKKILSFIPGTIKKIYVTKGKKVKPGDKLLDVEAMKMINTIFVESNSTIGEVYVKEGEMVPKNFLLLQYI